MFSKQKQKPGTSKNYREKLSNKLGLADFENAETALTNTPDFGGGSSFESNENSSFFTRWEKYRDNDMFRYLIEDKELIELSKIYFSELPGPY